MFTSLSVTASAGAAELPLGPPSLDERRSVAQVAPGVRWTRIARDGGPWRVNVLAVAAGTRVLAAPAGTVGARVRPSALSRRVGAVAAVNGNYFDADGNPIGALASGGRLLSEPVGGRTALLLGSAPPRIGALRFEGAVRLGGDTRLLDGINRTPGEIPVCGGRGGDRPTERPDAVTTCTDPSELVLTTPDWGARTPRRPGSLDALVRDGVVAALRPGGGTALPRDAAVVTATGRARTLLRNAGVGAVAELDRSLRLGSSVLPAGSVGEIVSAGPRLLTAGRVRVRSSAEGFNPLSAPWFYSSFVASRQPRTMAGVRRDGSLLLVTVDGRRPGWSAGVTLAEGARVMRALGARDALNLDGGGSTVMAVRGRAVSTPSDPSGERPVSNAVVVLG